MFDSQTIAQIEEQLETKLPSSYVQELLRYPFEVDSAPYHDDLWGDPEAIIENNLLLREGFGGTDWPEDYLAIGNDDVGNIYFLRPNDEAVYCAYVESADAGEIMQDEVAATVEAHVVNVRNIYRVLE